MLVCVEMDLKVRKQMQGTKLQSYVMKTIMIID